MRREKGIKERIKFLFKETDLEDLENSQPVCSVKNEKESFKKNIKVWLNYDSTKFIGLYQQIHCLLTSKLDGDWAK